MDFTQKAPPSDTELEMAVLSNMFFDNEVVEMVCQMLTADDFYSPANAEMFKAIMELHIAGEPIDLLIAKQKLESRKVFEQIGGKDYLCQIAGYTCTSVHAKHYALELKRLSEARQLLKAVLELAHKQDLLKLDDIKAVYEQAEKRQYIRSYKEKSVQSIDNFKQNIRVKKQRVFTGYPVLDKITGGFRIPSVAMIGAYPSVGKTAFALNIAVKQEKPVVFFSLEMSTEMIYERLSSAQLKIDYGLFSSQKLNDGQYDLIEEHADKLKQKQFHVFDDVYFIEQQSTVIANVKPCLVVVDYIQKVKTYQKTDARRHEIEAISGMYKQIAKHNNCTVLLLSQLSRAANQAKPTMANLKESGALEADGDYVGILHRPYVMCKDNPEEIKPEDGYILIDKNKFGNTGQLDLYFDGVHQRFYESEEDSKNPFL